jgi:hypothetical protein
MKTSTPLAHWQTILVSALLLALFGLIILSQIGPPARGCLKDYAATNCTSGVYNPQPNVPMTADSRHQAIVQYGFDPLSPPSDDFLTGLRRAFNN